MDKYKVVNRDLKYDGILFKVYRDEVEYPNHEVYVREKIEHCQGACVACLTSDNQLYFVKQYRYGVDQEVLELPAGKLDGDEDPFVGAQRELEEEVGVVADKWVDMGQFIVSGAYLSEVINLYFAYDLKPSHQHLDDDEFLDVSLMSLDDALAMIERNELIDGKTVALILKVKQFLDSQH